MHQLPKIPEYLKVRMAEIGPVWGLNVSNNVQEMIERFSQILAHSPRENLESFHEIHYGSDTRNVLDIFKLAGISFCSWRSFRRWFKRSIKRNLCERS